MGAAAAIDMATTFQTAEDTDPMMKESNKMAADSIINFKTVASFGNTEEFINTFTKAQ